MLGIEPQDEFSLFDAPAVVKISTSAGATKTLIGADVRRVLLVISNGSANPVYIGPEGTTGNQQGIFAPGNVTQPLSFDYNTHGPFLQLGWEVWSAAGGNVMTVYTVALTRPVGLSGYKGIFKDRESVPLATDHLPFVPPLKYSPLQRVPTAVMDVLRKRCPKLMGEG